ncbi:MAG: S8 family serine peptidase [Gammaproteobacteria bacterium]
MNNKIKALQQSYGVKLVNSWSLKSINLHCVVFELNKQQLKSTIINNISREPYIDSVQKMQLFQVFSTTKKSNTQSMLHLQKGIQSLGVKKAHKIATGKNIRIAIVDSGMDVHHIEFQNNIEEVKNFVEKPSQSFTSDIHGTAIAGIIASTNTHQNGIIGVSPNARLLAFKACWQTEQQWGKAFCNSFSLAKAINVAILRKVNILNLSLGGPYDVVIDKLIQKALSVNITVVAATGSSKNKVISFPASLPGVIAVNMQFNEDRKTLTTLSSDKKLCAPGTNIITTIPGNSYDFFSGSSLSTAFVSGSIALLLEKKPDLTPEKIYNLLEKSSTNNPSSNLKNINSCAALELLTNKKICN